jgi:DNA-binding NarL/FixJ family response regulator
LTAQADVAPPLVAALLGPRGLALEVFGRLLAEHGVSVVAEEDIGPDQGIEPDVAVLVTPLPEHWSAVLQSGVPIVVVLADEANDGVVLDAVLAGADAVLSFTASSASMLSVVDGVCRGGTVLTPTQVRAVASLARNAATRPAVALSRREVEILASIAAGQAVKQTARGLGISPKTVENLQSRLFRKLGVRNRAQAVARAHGLALL